MENLPAYISVVFGLTVLVALWLFVKATHDNQAFLIVLTGWIVFQSIIARSGFYTDTPPNQPRFLLLLLPPLLAIVFLLSNARARPALNRFDMKSLTLFHVIRLPVEIVLFWLCTNKVIPELMTFEGRNFDIVSGLSAPFVYYFGFVNNRVNKLLLLAWNFSCLALVVNVAIYGMLSAPTPFQQFAFEQPNMAIGYFPFNLLPSFLVPLVILSHLISIRQLLGKTQQPLKTSK